MFNVPSWSQRVVNAHNIRVGPLSAIVVERATPEYVGGMVSFLKQLREHATFAGKLIVPTTEGMEFLSTLNTFAGRPMFEGELVVCQNQYVLDDPLFKLRVRNESGRLVSMIEPKLEQANYDRALLDLHKLGKGHMIQLAKEGATTTAEGVTLRIEELQTKTACQNIYVNQLPPGADEQFTYMRTSAQYPAIRGTNFVDLVDEDNRYQHIVQGAVDFYKLRTGAVLAETVFQPKLFTVFPPKQYGYQPTNSIKVDPIEGPVHHQPKDIVTLHNYAQILGSSAMVPTKQANVAGNLLDFDGELFLVDCGEATLQQLLLSPTKPDLRQIKGILLTHEHLDHYGGLPAMYRYFSDRDIPFPSIYGSQAIKFFMSQQGIPRFHFVEVQTMLKKSVQITPAIRSLAVPINHTRDSVSYLLASANKCVMVSGDGRPTKPDLIKKAMETIGSAELSVVIHETTLFDQRDLAEEWLHSTVMELIEWDRALKPKCLLFTHLSARYAGEWLMGFLSAEDQARIVQGFDFLTREIP